MCAAEIDDRLAYPDLQPLNPENREALNKYF
jgi:hypothetical protein